MRPNWQKFVLKFLKFLDAVIQKYYLAVPPEIEPLTLRLWLAWNNCQRHLQLHFWPISENFKIFIFISPYFKNSKIWCFKPVLFENHTKKYEKSWEDALIHILNKSFNFGRNFWQYERNFSIFTATRCLSTLRFGVCMLSVVQSECFFSLIESLCNESQIHKFS